MSAFFEVDWANASVADRRRPTKALYMVLRELAKHLGARFDDLVVEAQGSPISDTEDPHRNFRRGEIAWQKAQTMHEWLAGNHYDFGQAKAPEMFQIPRRSEWEMFLQAHAATGGIRAMAVEPFAIARRDPPEDEATVFRIGQKFVFELTTPEPSYVVAFERYAAEWHPLPLAADVRNLKVQLRDGLNILPRDGKGAAIPLCEYDDTGLHQFAFVVSQDQRLPVDRKSIVAFSKDADIVVYLVQTRIIT